MLWPSSDTPPTEAGRAAGAEEAGLEAEVTETGPSFPPLAGSWPRAGRGGGAAAAEPYRGKWW